jgi:hypothetical protein
MIYPGIAVKVNNMAPALTSAHLQHLGRKTPDLHACYDFCRYRASGQWELLIKVTKAGHDALVTLSEAT